MVFSVKYCPIPNCKPRMSSFFLRNLLQFYYHFYVKQISYMTKKCTSPKVLSLRLGHDELTLSPTACDLLLFLVRGVPHLRELYVLVRSLGVTHDFMVTLLTENPLTSLKVWNFTGTWNTLTYSWYHHIFLLGQNLYCFTLTCCQHYCSLPTVLRGLQTKFAYTTIHQIMFNCSTFFCINGQF